METTVMYYNKYKTLLVTHFYLQFLKNLFNTSDIFNSVNVIQFSMVILIANKLLAAFITRLIVMYL